MKESREHGLFNTPFRAAQQRSNLIIRLRDRFAARKSGAAGGIAARNDDDHRIALLHYRTIALRIHNAIIPTPIVINAFFVRHATTIAINPASKRTLVSDTSI